MRQTAAKMKKGNAAGASFPETYQLKLFCKSLCNVNCAGNCAAYHWVVADSEESHHLDVSRN